MAWAGGSLIADATSPPDEVVTEGSDTAQWWWSIWFQRADMTPPDDDRVLGQFRDQGGNTRGHVMLLQTGELRAVHYENGEAGQSFTIISPAMSVDTWYWLLCNFKADATIDMYLGDESAAPTTPETPDSINDAGTGWHGGSSMRHVIGENENETGDFGGILALAKCGADALLTGADIAAVWVGTMSVAAWAAANSGRAIYDIPLDSNPETDSAGNCTLTTLSTPSSIVSGPSPSAGGGDQALDLDPAAQLLVAHDLTLTPAAVALALEPAAQTLVANDLVLSASASLDLASAAQLLVAHDLTLSVGSVLLDLLAAGQTLVAHDLVLSASTSLDLDAASQLLVAHDLTLGVGAVVLDLDPAAQLLVAHDLVLSQGGAQLLLDAALQTLVAHDVTLSPGPAGLALDVAAQLLQAHDLTLSPSAVGAALASAAQLLVAHDLQLTEGGAPLVFVAAGQLLVAHDLQLAVGALGLTLDSALMLLVAHDLTLTAGTKPGQVVVRATPVGLLVERAPEATLTVVVDD